MNRTKKRTRALFICFMAILFLFLLSCQPAAGPDAGGGNITADNGGQGENPQADDGKPVKLLPDLPDINYGGYEFTFLSMTDDKDYDWDDFLAEEYNGDVINDAKYERNIYVEDKYGVTINTVNIGRDPMNNGTAMLKRAHAAGDNNYDAAVLSIFDSAGSTTAGYLMDINSMPHINLSQPWWDQKANADLSIKDRIFFTTGDISKHMHNVSGTIIFNKQIAANYGLENLYQVVREGRWTWGKLSETTKMVSADLDGNGIFDENDLYGITIGDDIIFSIITSIGEKCASVNADGIIELTIYNERTVAAYDILMDFIWDETTTYQFQRNPKQPQMRMFENNQILFYETWMFVAIDLRGMETDFGILPYPKLNEQQRDYYTHIGNWDARFICVPAMQEDAERTGVIIEALAAESRYSVRPAYYDIALIGKHLRDEESEEMLDIILGTRTYDIGWYYNFGDYYWGMLNIIRQKAGNFASVYEKGLGRAEREIEKINGLFAELID